MLKVAVLKLLVNTDPNGRFLEIAAPYQFSF